MLEVLEKQNAYHHSPLRMATNSRPILAAVIAAAVATSVAHLKTPAASFQAATLTTVGLSSAVSPHLLLTFRIASFDLVFLTALWSFFDPVGLTVQAHPKVPTTHTHTQHKVCGADLTED